MQFPFDRDDECAITAIFIITLQSDFFSMGILPVKSLRFITKICHCIIHQMVAAEIMKLKKENNIRRNLDGVFDESNETRFELLIDADEPVVGSPDDIFQRRSEMTVGHAARIHIHSHRNQTWNNRDRQELFLLEIS